MKDIVIYGAGGLGLEIESLINNINKVSNDWNLLGFVDDNKPNSTLGGIDYFKKNEKDVYVVLAFGDPSVKYKIARKLKSFKNIAFANLIHPKATLMDTNNISLGRGVVIGAGAILTTSITIGNHVLVNLNATIGHGCQIGNHCSIMPGVNLAGDVQLEDNVLVGSGANILNGIKMEANSIAGSGAVVTKSVKANKRVVGIPAREL